MIITQTPLRVSFLGGNTDFKEYYSRYGGLVLTSTIDKYIYCIVKARFDDLIIVNYSIKETVTTVNDLRHDLVRECLRLLNITKGIEITFLADIPSEGTGLGSSSAVTIGLLNALHAYLGENVASTKLAQEAIMIEIDVLGKHLGIQDQCSIAFGGFRWIGFDEQINSERINISESIREDLNNSLMLFYTNISRKSEDILDALNIKENSILLNESKRLAVEGIKVLEKGDLRAFGQLLDEYWKLKKQLSVKITSNEIESMYDKAIQAGAIGGKIVGAGGGGFFLVMFPSNKRAAIRKALKSYKELPFRFTKGGSKVLLNIYG